MSDLPDILRRIVTQRRAKIAEIRSAGTGGRRLAGSPVSKVGESVDFSNALRAASERSVIAEVKLGSPRLGSLENQIDPVAQARLYAENGAAALSVVVEPDYFFGSYELLVRCREACGLPTLAKDFVVDPVQLEWASEAGASAVLLIAAILSTTELLDLAARARALGLEPLVECHADSEVSALAGHDWELVGVNNRNLSTFEVDLEHSIELVRMLPSGSCKVAESGIRTPQDIQRLEGAGFDAFLVGESLLTAENPATNLRSLVGRRTES